MTKRQAAFWAWYGLTLAGLAGAVANVVTYGRTPRGLVGGLACLVVVGASFAQVARIAAEYEKNGGW